MPIFRKRNLQNIRNMLLFKLSMISYDSPMVENTLRELGLTDNEVIIYLSLLPLRKAPASTLGYRTNIERNAARYICQQLTKKGIVSETRENNTCFYHPEPPDRLLNLLKETRQQLETKEAKINRIMGQLRAIADPETVLPRIKFYEGSESYLKVYSEMLDALESDEKELYTFAKLVDGEDDPCNMYPLVEETIQKRCQKGVFIKVLTPRTKTSQQRKKEDKAFLRETRFLPSEFCDFNSCEITICRNKVYTFSQPGAAFCYEIEHPEIVKIYRRLFEMAWSATKKD